MTTMLSGETAQYQEDICSGKEYVQRVCTVEQQDVQMYSCTMFSEDWTLQVQPVLLEDDAIFQCQVGAADGILPIRLGKPKKKERFC